MARFNFLASGYVITDEVINRTRSTASKIGHDLILGTVFEIWTGASGTGTKLVVGTDYSLTDESAVYTAKVGETVYTKLSVINGAYHSIDLYVSYKTVGDLASVENTQEIALEYVESNGSATPEEGKVMVWPSQSENANTNIVYRKVTGTTPPTQGSSITVSIPNASKALFAFGKIMTSTDSLPFFFTGADGSQVNFVGGYIYRSGGVFAVVTSSTASPSVLSKPFEAYIAYTE